MRNRYGWSLIAILCMAGVASAQGRTTQPAREGERAGAQGERAGAQGGQAGAQGGARGGQAAAQGTSDQQIAAFLLGGARNEIELARLAQEQAKSDSVKEYAAMMIKDHSAQLEKLERMAGGLAAASGEQGEARATEGRRTEARRVPPEGEDANRRDNDTPRDQARAGAREEAGGAREGNAQGGQRGAAGGQGGGAVGAQAGGQGGALNWTMVHKQIADQHLQSTKKELGRYEGDDFDKAYMGHQIVAHMQMRDKLTVVQKHASQQLQQQLEQDSQTVEHHLQEAQRIMKEQKDQGSERSSGRESGARSKSGGTKSQE